MKRKMSDDAKERKSAYDARYMKENIKQRTIGFNVGDKEDMKMYNWIGQQKPNGTQYIKGLVREDMKKSGE